jgi:hypothetical protein
MEKRVFGFLGIVVSLWVMSIALLVLPKTGLIPPSYPDQYLTYKLFLMIVLGIVSVMASTYLGLKEIFPPRNLN